MNSRKLQCLGLLGSLLLATLLYWPGLSSSYLFDDFPNIVDNNEVHVTRLDWHDWRLAASASPSTQLRRPLAMLSFAANYFFTGLDPWSMKLTNLLIHLLNGVLLWAVLSKLLNLWNQRRETALPDTTIQWAALGVATAWLLCPINLSPVLYVVQRMESLAQGFVLLGLWLYLHQRQRMLNGRGGAILCAGSLVLPAALGFLCKESALLLPLYAFLIEWAVLRFDGSRAADRRRLWTMFGVLLFLPALLGLTWVLSHNLAATYAMRPFTLEQRLLTEGRVLVEYAIWTLLPLPGSLGFYHDDIALSHGWLAPPGTLLCAVLIAAALAAAVALRHRMPLLALGILWYFAAHLLTATIIPLELVFEHRNYFASIGLLLAACALLLQLPAHLQLLRRALPVLALAAFAAALALQARDWGNPVRFAYAGAQQHPQSPRANYELGRTLVVLSGYRPDSRLIEPAIQAFETAAALPGSNGTPDAALILIANHMHRQVPQQWWDGLAAKLSAQPPSEEDIGALQALLDCQHQGDCTLPASQMLPVFLAAMNHPQPGARLMALYGAFAANQMNDLALASRLFRDAVALSPGIVGYRIDLARILYLQGEFIQASAILHQLSENELSQAEGGEVEALNGQIESGLKVMQPSLPKN